jgi:two-component system, chemotaxis family, sensor kinase CheA
MEIDPGLQAFKDESHELLGSVEDILLQLEADPDNNDLVNELFRAVHTIKGASGLFGFDDVVNFTHQAESVMGRLRDSEIELSDTLTTLFLESRDHILLLVEDALNGSHGLSEEDKAKGNKLHDELGQFLNNQETQESNTDEVETVSENVIDDARQVSNDNWHISLRFGRDVLRMGMDPHSFLRYLQTVGDITSLTTVYDDLPSIQEMDPESCYLGFEIDLKSEARKEDIENVFEFVQEDCVIHILPPHSHIEHYIELIKSLPEENLRVGDILTMTGALTKRELEEALAAQNEERQQGDEHQEKEHPLGEVVVEQGVVETEVVQAALDKQQQTTANKAEEKQSIRVSADKLSELINLVGELVIASANTEVTARQAGDESMVETTSALSHLVEEIRDTALNLRMVEIGATFNRFRRVVREVSRNLGKDIDLIINGGDTELDKIVIDKIADPLMHLVRNSLDHGFEMPDQRREKGKSPKGTLELKAFHDSGSIVITINDDGNGLPKEKILNKALERGLIKEDHNMTDKEIYKLIFEPGFSTAEAVTDISGRGVGMDVVRRNIDALRGQVDVDSQPGLGTEISIRLPLTLAIIDGFLTRVGQHSYVIPLDMVDECMEFQVDSNTYIDSNFINLRGEVLPFVRLNKLFNDTDTLSKNDAQDQKENIIVTNYAGNKTGFIVNELLGEYQTVIKPLGEVFKDLKGISGATILGNGEVAMIVDVPGLVQHASLKHITTVTEQSGSSQEYTH